MSVRTSTHFMTHCGGPLPKIELRPHPRLPIMILTLVDGDHDFVWSDTAERMREMFTAILADPVLAAPASVPPAVALQEVGAAAHGPEIEEEEAMPQTRASGAARRLMRAAEAAACEVRRQEFIWADEILWAAMKPIAVAMKRSHVLEDAQRVYAALENARRFLKDEDEGGALDALAKASPIVADAIAAPASAASEPKAPPSAPAAAPAPIVRGEE